MFAQHAEYMVWELVFLVQPMLRSAGERDGHTHPYAAQRGLRAAPTLVPGIPYALHTIGSRLAAIPRDSHANVQSMCIAIPASW
jgi:hypothetical protein